MKFNIINYTVTSLLCYYYCDIKKKQLLKILTVFIIYDTEN